MAKSAAAPFQILSSFFLRFYAFAALRVDSAATCTGKADGLSQGVIVNETL